MGATVIAVDGEGNLYGFDAAALDTRRRHEGPSGGYFDMSEEELAAARLPDTARAALQTAMTYEQAGGVADPAAGEVMRLGPHASGPVLRIVGHVG